MRAIELGQLRDLAVDLDLTGFEGSEIDALFAELSLAGDDRTLGR